ncbi:6-phosphogluconolactonase [Amphritea atlantica]|uniref:6-phosphogluconolactonase n=1 Tax=Amphritea atlantica TaxID=355243 RepID=A0A1H9GLL6_9GAMM|nr:6-phosphogluconolactonase [Amphritea atlantica]SEQ50818.1 6-phosphogluconolactonase [Amphritea atlantica]
MKISDLNLPAHVTVCAFDSREALTDNLSTLLQHRLLQAIENRGRASLAVSGGSTPVPLFQKLSHAELAWESVTVTLVDDRWISPDESDSNDGLLHTHLLQNRATEAHYIPLWQPDSSAEAAVDRCNTRLAAIDGPLDIVILGMGNDGHTASLFPCSSELEAALASNADCVAVNPTTAPYARISLTPARLLNSELRILHICGNDKLETLSRALTSQPESMPIKLFLQHPIMIYWAP